MRNMHWTSRRDRFVCPLCEVGELHPSSQAHIGSTGRVASIMIILAIVLW
jgi:hypothetical protein